MSVSVFDLLKIGIGPSSSHTVGPMRAARTFAAGLDEAGVLGRTAEIRVELFGSLGATGHGHGSPKAVLLGLEGETPEGIDPDQIDEKLERISATGRARLLGRHEITFDPAEHLIMHRRKRLPAHPNGMTFAARDSSGNPLRDRTYYSVGGGFVVEESAAGADRVVPDATELRHPFRTGAELLAITAATGLSISDVMLANETAWRSEPQVRAGLLEIWQIMQDCVSRGCTSPGILPGGLQVRRRAPALHAALAGSQDAADPLHALDWVTLFALAVNEENAAGGRVVTAPTNGAAGIVPAVLHYYQRFVPGADDDGTVRFLLAAGAIGLLFKENASISGAEVGCQGEVGSACAMAAGGLAEALGGSPGQVENAAEIGMEHNLGLTCDPIGGLVQIPCIRTMRQTGADMMDKYKETSRGGLAVNIIEC